MIRQSTNSIIRHPLSLILTAVFLTPMSFGCEQKTQKIGTLSQDKPPIFYEDIAVVSLMVDLPLVDVNGDGHPNGAALRVSLLRANEPQYVAGKGTLNVYLMQRVSTPEGRVQEQELYRWTIQEEDFVRAAGRHRYGLIAHQMTLYWANVRPQGSGVYLEAEFIRKDQQTVWSRPIPLVF